jgi:two-component system phosphate regulon sensor histidine kinase PhoR
VEGKKIKEIVKFKELRKIISHAIKTNELIEDEIIIPPDDRYVQLHGIRCLKMKMGDTIGALVVLNDVTRLRRLEVVRRDFVANVSHEIRTPLTSIKGFIETLLDGAIEEPETAKRFLKIMIKQSNRLNSIIEELLALASIEESEKRQIVQFSETKIKNMIDSAISVCLPRAQNKNITLKITGNDKIKLVMNATLVEQALVNLIDNAIKYSAENTSVEIEGMVDKNECIISVKDQGIGIAKEQLPRIFERFYRVDKARSRTLGGTGLGLAIVKHIAKVLNGRVTVESEVGKGSTFKFIIPKLKKLSE